MFQEVNISISEEEVEDVILVTTHRPLSTKRKRKSAGSRIGVVHILVPYSDVSSSDVSFPPSLLIFVRVLIVNRHSF